MKARKTLSAIVAGGAALALLAGCSGGSSGGSSDDGNVELNVWTFGGMGLDDLFEKYQAENPNVTLKITNAGGADEQAQALTTALAGGKGPDVAAIEIGYMAQFKAQPQNFVDLRTLGADDIQPSFLDWRWEQGVAADGSVVGIPTDVGGLAMAYRTDLFEAAGLPTDRDEVSALWPTWEDFIDVGNQYTEATGKGMVDNVVNSVYNPVVRQGDQMYYGDGPEDFVYESNPQVQKAFDLALDSLGLSSRIGSFSEEWNAGMNNGDFAVLAAPAWMTTYISQQAPDTSGKWDIAAVPEDAGNWGGSQLTIPKNSEHPEEAYEFISWLMAPEQQLEVFQTHGNFPSTPELYETPDIQEFTSTFFSDAPVGPIYANSVETIQPIYEGPQQRIIDNAIQNTIGQVENGEEPADGAWERAMDNVETALQ
ncbi:extracellular solute-binding protein [Microbacterium sp. SSW1-59]|uniref:ABC transporter substrate-binding protein n=1 Tax=Microbacterium xanthum TaxID=3079794 RepID=UPI002AD3FF89|nr:extracellular solute-binding protein [Microbacterium sp. SSW1-59]MDZ8200748.1 extracellular solute-binding protein [Microbacterium sp. SSW1-59]